MYAIVEINGKQYRVEKGSVINVDKLDNQDKTIALDKILMYVDGEDVMVGQPYLDKIKITAKNCGLIKGRKVKGIKFKNGSILFRE